MDKILSNRIILAAMLGLAACSSGGPEKRVNEGEGPFSAHARNALAAENPEGLVKIAEGFERSGNFESAYRLYGQAMAAAPELASPRLGLARITGKMGRVDTALAMLGALSEEFPENVDVAKARIELFIREARYDEADTEVQALLGHGVRDGFLWDVAGRLAQVTGDIKRARAMFDHALAVRESQMDAMRHMALSFAMEGEFESAVALLQKAMDSPAAALDAKRSLAMIYALSGQLKAARVIALSAMTQQEVNALVPVYSLLPKLDAKAQAAVMMFDHLPASALPAPDKD